VTDQESCPFCSADEDDSDFVFVEQRRSAAAFLHPRRRTRGAMLVIPTRHVRSLLDLTDQECAAVLVLVRDLSRAAVAALGCAGVQVIQNNGREAGQTVAHVHFHVIPRYVGEPYDARPGAELPELPYEERLRVRDVLRRHLGPPSSA